MHEYMCQMWLPTKYRISVNAALSLPGVRASTIFMKLISMGDECRYMAQVMGYP